MAGRGQKLTARTGKGVCVCEYSDEFELHMGRLESFDERSLIQQFIWGLEESLAKAVTLKYPKTIHAAIGHAEAIELAGIGSK